MVLRGSGQGLVPYGTAFILRGAPENREMEWRVKIGMCGKEDGMMSGLYDLVIVGAGPAGLSAAVYAKRAGLKTLVLEKCPICGGQILNTYEVDNYLGLPGMNGFDLGMKFREHADRLGVEFLETETLGIAVGGGNVCLEKMGDEKEKGELEAAELRSVEPDGGKLHMVKTKKGDFCAKAVLLATGAAYAKLGVEGEEELTGMGVSYCATCDGAFFRNRTVAVIGGGDVAVEDAIFLARTCGKVYLVHRRDELRAAKILQEKVKGLPNVEILWDTVVGKIKGEEQVDGITLRNVKTGEEKNLPVDGVFIAVGIRPNTEAFAGVADLDEKGYLVAGEDCATTTPGIYAAGDVRTKMLRQVVTAVADGANAVTGIQNYFNGVF